MEETLKGISYIKSASFLISPMFMMKNLTGVSTETFSRLEGLKQSGYTVLIESHDKRFSKVEILHFAYHASKYYWYRS